MNWSEAAGWPEILSLAPNRYQSHLSNESSQVLSVRMAWISRWWRCRLNIQVETGLFQVDCAWWIIMSGKESKQILTKWNISYDWVGSWTVRASWAHFHHLHISIHPSIVLSSLGYSYYLVTTWTFLFITRSVWDWNWQQEAIDSRPGLWWLGWAGYDC